MITLCLSTGKRDEKKVVEKKDVKKEMPTKKEEKKDVVKKEPNTVRKTTPKKAEGEMTLH